jgi:hypothetical protein
LTFLAKFDILKGMNTTNNNTTFDFLTFALAGHALFTVVSKRTNRHFTYRISKKPLGIWVVRVLAGPDNLGDFRYLGVIRRKSFSMGRTTHTFIAANGVERATASIAFSWIWTHSDHTSIEIHHAGKCGACGRTLTVPDSIKSGLGPVCAARAISVNPCANRNFARR